MLLPGCAFLCDGCRRLQPVDVEREGAADHPDVVIQCRVCRVVLGRECVHELRKRRALHPEDAFYARLEDLGLLALPWDAQHGPRTQWQKVLIRRGKEWAYRPMPVAEEAGEKSFKGESSDHNDMREGANNS